MSSSSAPVPVEYEETWLPSDFKPITFKQLVWNKVTSAPLVGIGCIATVYSLVMASYQMKLGNSARFNYWLRWRVGSQGLTIAAAAYYGGVAYTRSQQEQYQKKQLVLLGELPPNTPIPKANNDIWGRELTDSSEYRNSVVESQDPNYRPPSSTSSITDEPDDTAHHYPLPLAERMRISEFAAKLRRAEALQHEEDLAKESRRDGAQSVTNAGDLLTRRMEKAMEDRGDSGRDRKGAKVLNKHKLRKSVEQVLERQEDSDDTQSKEVD